MRDEDSVTRRKTWSKRKERGAGKQRLTEKMKENRKNIGRGKVGRKD